jgi:hypothetical protein
MSKTPKHASDPEIEKLVAEIVRTTVRTVEANQKDEIWRSYTYSRIAMCLLQESGLVINDELVRLLDR